MPYEELLKQESIKQSPHSPNVIEDNEKIARVLFTPKHFDNGKVLAVAFEQILHKNGMSVLRLNYDFSNSLKKTIQLLQKDDTNQYCGYVCANVKSIRNILKDNYRLFYLLDTAKKDRISHADVFAIRPNEKINLPKKALKNYLRKKIAETFIEIHEEFIIKPSTE